MYFHWRRNISFILKKIFNFQFTFTFPPTFNFPHNFFPCLFPTEAARYFLIAPFLFVEEEKPAAMHGGDRRNATSRASINVMLIFLTFLGIRASNRLCPRQARATWPAYPVNFELIQATESPWIISIIPLLLSSLRLRDVFLYFSRMDASFVVLLVKETIGMSILREIFSNSIHYF